MATDGQRASVGGLSRYKAVLLFSVLGCVLLADIGSKQVVERTMHPYQEIELIGDYVRLTFIHNPGAAFGIRVGDWSRWVFVALALVALGALLAMYWFTPARDTIRLGAIALVSAGAVGNLIDRIRSPLGVIDFLDVGIGSARWPVFNVADMAVTAGAIILALSLWQEERVERRR